MQPFVELERFPNRIGKCTLVYPTRPSLGHPISQFDSMPAVYKMQARVMATWMIANERATFADPWVESHPNAQGEIIEVADEHRADLIVIGTHEAGVLRRLFRGEVSDGIVRKAHCDVLVVHSELRRDS